MTTPQHKDTTLDEIQSLRDKFNQGGMNYSQIVGEESTVVSMQLKKFNATLTDILQWRDKAVVEAELSRFQYDDWEVGDDDKLRLGDFINCNHQRAFDGYEQNFEGQIIKHHDNEMPVVIYNVDPKDPDNSGDYATLQDMYMQGWKFSRLAALKETPNED